MRTFKKILCTFLIVVMCLTVAPLNGFVGLEWPKINVSEWFSIKSEAAEIVASGECGVDGDNVIWTLYADDQLIISGTGDMYDFYEYSSIYKMGKTVIVEEGVTSIGDYAFYKCDNIEMVVLPKSLTSIGWNSFAFCSNLIEINIPNNVTILDSQAFYSCDKLAEVVIGNSVVTIGTQAFAYCNSLANIIVPNNVVSIFPSAFYGCRNLLNISLSDKLKTIGKDAFLDTAYYKDEENWKNKILYIGKHLIKADVSLWDYLTIKDGTITIADYAFAECTELRTVIIPDSVLSIGKNAFENCYNIIDINLGKNIITIGVDAFAKCSKLVSIFIPDSVATIGAEAFYYCYNLYSVRIGKGVESIGTNAFYQCYNLKEVAYNGTEEQWKKINIDSSNSCLINAVIFFEDSDSEEENNTSTFTGEISGILTSWDGLGFPPKAYIDDVGYQVADDDVLYETLSDNLFKKVVCLVENGIIISCESEGEGFSNFTGEISGILTAWDGLGDSPKAYIDDIGYKVADDDVLYKTLYNNLFKKVVCQVENGIVISCKFEIIENEELFHNGYDFYNDSLSFHNFRRKPTEEDFKRIYKPSKAHILYLVEGDYGVGGNCYGITLTTIALLNNTPSVNEFWNRENNSYCSYINDITRNNSETSTKETELNDDCIVIQEEGSSDENKYYSLHSISEFVNCAHLTWFASETVERNMYDCVSVYNAVVEYVNGERDNPPIIVMTKDAEGTACHAVLGVGIKDNKIIINDSNYENEICYLELEEKDGIFTGSWNYFDYQGNKTESKGLIEWLDGDTYHYMYNAFKNNLNSDTNIEDKIEYLESHLSDNRMLLVTNTQKFNSEYSFYNSKIIYPENSDTNNATNNYLYWLDDNSNKLTFDNIQDSDAKFMLSDNYSSINATVSNCKKLQIEVDDDSMNMIKLQSSEDTSAIISFINYKNDCVEATFSVVSAVDDIEVVETEKGLFVTGVQEGTVTLTTNGKIIATQTITDADGEIEITYDKNGNNDKLDVEYESNSSAEPEIKNCSCNCHKGGIAGFFFKLILFFQKIFRTNKTCSCGVNHY